LINIFIIPYHPIGGAERVHLEIIKTLDFKPIVIFSNTKFQKISLEYKINAYCFYIPLKIQRILLVIGLRILSYFFKITLFGCNNLFFYQVISKLNNQVTSIDLTHAFSLPDIGGVELMSLPFIKYLDKRIVINNKTYEDYKLLYESNKISNYYFNKIEIIPNGIEIKEIDQNIIQSRFDNFIIGFVGRNSIEKRPSLFFDLSLMFDNKKIKFKAIGDNFNNYKNKYKYIEYFEGCNDPDIIRREFSKISLLIVPSYREGFPLVIMEAMELGIPVIATNVGSISTHLIDSFNGYLCNDIDEVKILNFAYHKILKLFEDDSIYRRMSLNAREYAINNFSISKFKKSYKELFIN